MRRIFSIALLAVGPAVSAAEDALNFGAAETEAQEDRLTLDEGMGPEEAPWARWQAAPLNLNTASEDDLRRLPGVDIHLARKIISRRRSAPFGNVEELRHVPGLDDKTFEGFRRLVTVVRAPLFRGDMRFRLRSVNPPGTAVQSADPGFQNNTYLYHRARVFAGRRARAGYMLKRGVPGPAVTAANAREYMFMKASAEALDAGPFRKLVAGDYSLAYGQGLVFYEGLGEFVRPVKVKEAGAQGDFSTGTNQFMRGGALELRQGLVDAALFVSRKALDLKVDPATGRVNQDINELREDMGDVTSTADLKNRRSTEETMWGSRLAFRGGRGVLGVMAARQHYSRVIDPVDAAWADALVFRGDTADIYSVDFDVSWSAVNVFGEGALSKTQGPGVAARRDSAWTVTPLLSAKPFRGWMTLFHYGPHFFTRHGKGPSFEVLGPPKDLTTNQQGAQWGLEHRTARWATQFQFTVASFPGPLGTGRGTAPVQASASRQLYVDSAWKPVPTVELYGRRQNFEEDVFEAASAAGPKQQARHFADKWRGQVTWWTHPRLRLRLRYDLRIEKSNDVSRTGDLVMTGAFFKPSPATAVDFRYYFFNAPAVSLTTGSEEIWNGVYYPRLAGGLQDLEGSPGTRLSVVGKYDTTRMSLWLKYDVNQRPAERAAGRTSRGRRQGLHAQLDWRWGRAVRRGARSRVAPSDS